ncbi:MAG: hypothetical protein CL911_04085 [Deltaproteobacteria bacterium]|nr:hypothetical protein [Deltaproteobacteria bacterium]
MIQKLLRILALGMLLGGMLASPLAAITKPKWELGVSHLEALVPHYAGSNHYYFRSFSFPYGIYRLESLDVGSAPKLYLELFKNLHLEVALGFEFPVEADSATTTAPSGASDANATLVRDKNYTRRGMTNQQALLGVGAKLVWYVNDHLTLNAPFLNKRTLGGGLVNIGNDYSVRASFDLFDRNSNYTLGVGYTMDYGDSGFNQFYYGVPAADALSDRTAYDAPAGLISRNEHLFAGAQITSRLKMHGVSYRYRLNDSVVQNSPLVVTKENRSFVWGIVYAVWQSFQTVNRPEK